MFDHGIRWSGLIVKLCGCDVQALQMNSRWMRQLMVLSVLAEGADRSIQQFGQRRRWWKSRAGRPDKEGEGDHRGASRLLGLGQSTSALYESVSRLRRPPPGRTLPRTSSSMWLTSGIGIAGNVMRQAPIANPGKPWHSRSNTLAPRMSARRAFHSQIDQFKPDSPDRTGEINEVIGPDLVTRCGGIGVRGQDQPIERGPGLSGKDTIARPRSRA